MLENHDIFMMFYVTCLASIVIDIIQGFVSEEGAKSNSPVRFSVVLPFTTATNTFINNQSGFHSRNSAGEWSHDCYEVNTKCTGVF